MNKEKKLISLGGGEREERGTTAGGITTPPRLVGGCGKPVGPLMIDGGVLGFARTVTHNTGIRRRRGRLNRFDGFGEGADLIDLHQNGIGHLGFNSTT